MIDTSTNGAGPADEDSELTERDIVALIVGTGRDPGVERLIDLTEVGQEAAVPQPSVDDRFADVLGRAGEHGYQELFERFIAAARCHGLETRPYEVSLMFTPPANRTRCLFVIWRVRRKPFLAITPDGSRLFIGLYNQAEVTWIDTRTGTVGSTIPTGGRAASGFALSPDGRTLYVSGGDYTTNASSVAEVSTTGTPSVIGVIAGFLDPTGVAVTKNTYYSYPGGGSGGGGGTGGTGGTGERVGPREPSTLRSRPRSDAFGTPS